MTEHSAPHPHLSVGGRVLAAIDASGYNDSVSHLAAWAAARLGAPLDYLHVLDRHPEAAAIADFSGNLALDSREKLLQDLVAVDESRSRLGQERGRLDHHHGVELQALRLRRGQEGHDLALGA